MNRGSTKKQRLEGQQHYDELESDIDEKASERFHTPPAYQSYSVEDYILCTCQIQNLAELSKIY